jgi:hypothetical protein
VPFDAVRDKTGPSFDGDTCAVSGAASAAMVAPCNAISNVKRDVPGVGLLSTSDGPAPDCCSATVLRPWSDADADTVDDDVGFTELTKLTAKDRTLTGVGKEARLGHRL